MAKYIQHNNTTPVYTNTYIQQTVHAQTKILYIFIILVGIGTVSTASVTIKIA